MTELWKDIPGYEGRYQISDLGRVKALSFMQRYLLKTGQEAWRKTRPKFLAQQMQNSGYMLVHLHLDNQRKAHTVHRLVAAAFVPGSGPTVNHRDGNKTHNAAGNLEWATYPENLIHAIDTGLRKTRHVRAVCKAGSVQVFASAGRAVVALGKSQYAEASIRAAIARNGSAWGYRWSYVDAA